MVQQQLLLDDRDRWRLIRGLQLPGLTKLQNGRIRRVLEAVYIAQSANRGESVSRRLEDLADQMDCSIDSARRWVHLAEDHGCIVAVAVAGCGGRQANEYSIDWNVLRHPSWREKPEIHQDGGPPSQNARAPSQNARAPSQNARAFKEQVQVEELTCNVSPPPTRISDPDECWQEVEEALRDEGVIFAGQARAVALAKGTPPTRILAIIAHYRSRPGAWTPGALFRRVEIDHPSIAIDQGWPPVSRAVARTDLLAQARALYAARSTA